MLFLKKRKADKPIVTAPDFGSLPKPSGDILFDVAGSSIKLHLKDPDAGEAWLVVYNRSLGSYCVADGIRLSGPVILMKDLVSLGLMLEAGAEMTRIRICLYLPGQNKCHYLKHYCYKDKSYTDRAQYVLPLKDQSGDARCRLTTYLSESGLLALGCAESYFAPRGHVYITPENLDADGTVDLREIAAGPEKAPVFWGLYSTAKEEMHVFSAKDGAVRLQALQDMLDLASLEMEGEYYPCLIRAFSEAACQYINIVASYDRDNMAGIVPLVLEHQYDSLITPPLPVSDDYYAALRFSGRRRVYLDRIPADEIFKYHCVLFESEMPETDVTGVLTRFDPEIEAVTADSFDAYIRKCLDYFAQHHYSDADLLRAKKRVLYNVAGKLSAAADIRGQYEAEFAKHDEIWPALASLLGDFEDDLIMKTTTSRYMKMFLMQVKYGRPCDIEERIQDCRLYFGETSLTNLGRMLLRIEIIKIIDHNLIIEGCMKFPAMLGDEKTEPVCFINNVVSDYTRVERYADEYIFGRLYQRTAGFKLTIPLEEERYKVSFGIRGFGIVSICRSMEFSGTSPLGSTLANGYYYQDGYVVKASKAALLCLICDEEKHLFYENLLRQEIERRSGTGAENILALRQYYWEHKDDQGEDLWLMLDRPDRADDNAEVFFRYVAGKNFEHVKPVFVLSSANPDYTKLSEVGTVVDFRSEEHLKAFLVSKYVFSSHYAVSTINPFNEDFHYFRDIIRQKKFVFLQHGVTHNDNGLGFSHYLRDFYGIVVSGNEEYDYLCSPELSNDPETIWLTGMPRFDRVYNDDQRIITIMPTWRKYLTTRVYDEAQQTSIWKVKDTYKESEYFNFYNSLINDERLIKAARDKNYTIQLMPHVQFLKQADDFEIRYPDVVSLCHYDTRYCDVFSKSSLILTDFSSIGFDFGYLYKPVIYCQFDKEAFYKNHTVKPGYYQFEQHGFGEILYDLPGTIETLIDYIGNDCRMKDVYRQRVDAFFRYTDHSCCERICSRVFELE